jgi:7-carboxy-7-deazaguanine synthase
MSAHRVALLQTRPPGELLVHEIYHSVQGESTYAGLPCVFVRLSVCDLRCVWCDTPHAFNQGTAMTPDAIIARIQAFACPLVEFTGGEPLLQAEVRPLMTRVADLGYTVLLETSGASPLAGIDPRVQIIMDLKCPDSGESARNLYDNLAWLKPADQIKFVIASAADFAWTVQTIRKYNLDRRFTVLLSAVFGRVTPLQLTEWLLASGLQVRLQLQMHKYIWPPDTRGV